MAERHEIEKVAERIVHEAISETLFEHRADKDLGYMTRHYRTDDSA
jgi:hypothetical protein